jgi:hypothetical protein
MNNENAWRLCVALFSGQEKNITCAYCITIFALSQLKVESEQGNSASSSCARRPQRFEQFAFEPQAHVQFDKIGIPVQFVTARRL